MIKVIVFVKRNPALTPEEFHRHWREVHARLVAETPSVARRILHYEQNPRSKADYARDAGDDDGYDGVAIACYRSRADMQAVFEDPAYVEQIQPDEQRLSDPSRNVWIVSEEAHVVIGDVRSSGGPS